MAGIRFGNRNKSPLLVKYLRWLEMLGCQVSKLRGTGSISLIC